MIRNRGCLIFGMIGSLVVVLSGCTGGGTARDNAELLEEAVAAAQTALEAALPGIPGEVEALGKRNGIPVVQYHAPEDATVPFTGAYGYGAWLGERGFAVYSAPAAHMTGVPYILADPADASHGAPGAADGFSGTWSGVMLGVDTHSSDDDAGVQGNAELNLHSGMDGATVDIEFSDVVGIQSGEAYHGHSWDGISVTGSGFASDGSSIDGQFYGDHHEDVIGNFAYDYLRGAWGASRMEAGAGAGGDDMDGDGDMDGGDMDGGDMDDGDMDGGDMDGGDMDGGDMDGGDMDGGDMDGGDMDGGDMDGGDMDGGDMDGGDMDGGDMDGGDMDGGDMDGGDMDGGDMDGGDMDGGDMDGGDMDGGDMDGGDMDGGDMDGGDMDGGDMDGGDMDGGDMDGGDMDGGDMGDNNGS